jgi:hypothetical protein
MPSPYEKPKRPWSGFGYLIIIVVAVLAAYFVILPIGQQVGGVFQTLTHALGGK